MIDANEIKEAALEGIALKPTHIALERYEKVSNGMNGFRKEKVTVGEYDVFIDDSNRSSGKSDSLSTVESGGLFLVRSLTLLIVIDSLLVGDFFILNRNKYEVVYPGELVQGVYNADIKIVGDTDG
ncbi:hypothetical protein [Clostridium perfringens]|mgnify:CR=1 FL=1|jgi:hypothetical protein|uniref:hypothetical protein n=1 Tax=Clostridium perfringens TaxID=1502 RepID=UPI00096A39BA|nr:hypothetical protein [Clostridium perfringens]DAL46468.1 MAG TPA_asm: hypothetical protein [Caudoviricetes sp.]MDM0722976.1 hypothetical protein [Clostridium perfringens]MDM0726016.1 hypothetical protein [Clostridium perfringens]MEA5268738.1 hypothetical protein [Clostridium perfringens]MEA5380339.1 hypothetical protein [Clostridium perfringens]